MPRNGYEDGGYDVSPGKNYQRDIILSVNEFCFVQNRPSANRRSPFRPRLTLSSRRR